jgi:phosphopantetheinyl transferase
MSDTPETDNLARGNHVVSTGFAQDLERQLIAARTTVNRLRRERAVARQFGEQMQQQCDQWRECASRLLVYAECMSARVPEKSQINWTVLEQARAMFREQSK